MVRIKSVQLSKESSHNTFNTPNSLISTQTFSITNTIILQHFPHFTPHIAIERMLEEDDFYVEDFHENNDSDDIHSDSVVDEANENEAVDAEDDHAETKSSFKGFCKTHK